jgi:hypothetical protein
MPRAPVDASGRRIRVGDRVTVASAEQQWRGTVAYVLMGPTVAWVGVRRRGQRWAEMTPPGAVLVAERPRGKRKPAKRRKPAGGAEIEVTMVRPRRRGK